jgi:hypothetical protein
VAHAKVALVIADALTAHLSGLVTDSGHDCETATAAGLDLAADHPRLWLLDAGEAQTLAKRTAARPAGVSRLLLVVHRDYTRRLDAATRRYARHLGTDLIVLLPAGRGQVIDALRAASGRTGHPDG